MSAASLHCRGHTGSVTGKQRLNFHHVFHSHPKLDALIYRGGGGKGVYESLLYPSLLFTSYSRVRTVSNSFKPVFWHAAAVILHGTQSGWKLGHKSN